MVRSSEQTIRIEQLEISASVGVTDEERTQPQRIVLTVTIWPDAAFDQLQDDIGRTINYVDLCRAAREFVENREWKLIESIASELASHLLSQFPVRASEVEVRKFVLPNTAYVSATVRKDMAV